MNRTPVSSSNLNSVGYDPETLTLEVAFHSGGIYQYYKVPQAIYDALMSAPSHGKYLAYRIKKFYAYKRIG